MKEIVKLIRDVEAVQIPFGTKSILDENTEAIIVYALGGSYTITANDAMYRIENKDADALGKTPKPTFAPTTNNDQSLEDKIWNILRTCYDPEIPVNIVDLGLVYGVDTAELDKDKFSITIRMTLTAPGCGMGPVITEEAKEKVSQLPEVETIEIEMVFDPPWDRSMMSEQAKLELGLF